MRTISIAKRKLESNIRGLVFTRRLQIDNSFIFSLFSLSLLSGQNIVGDDIWVLDCELKDTSSDSHLKWDILKVKLIFRFSHLLHSLLTSSLLLNITFPELSVFFVLFYCVIEKLLHWSIDIWSDTTWIFINK